MMRRPPPYIRVAGRLYRRSYSQEDAVSVLRDVGTGLGAIGREMKSPDQGTLTGLDGLIGELQGLRDDIAGGLFKRTIS